MRNRLLFLLLATISMPAVAADDASDRAAAREAARAERAEARSERQAERQAERVREAPRPDRPAEARAIEPRGHDRAVELDRPVPARVIERRLERDLGDDRPRPMLEQRRESIEQRRGDVDSVRNWRREEREQIRATRSPGPKMVVAPVGSARDRLMERRQDRIEGRDSIGNRRAPIVSRVPREGTQPPPPTTAPPSSLTAKHWRGDWRNDRRYDWRGHRRRHRNLFHFGFYFDPFGWGYRPYSIGWRLWPHYYRSSYWLRDPWMYRLPYAPAGYRWIRYYDDALLVDTWDGTVVDVIHDFFW